MDKNYDDGLVHSHNWASEPATPAKPQLAAETATSLALDAEEQHLYDDGLVHCHDWARS
jgi:hypothetical protein